MISGTYGEMKSDNYDETKPVDHGSQASYIENRSFGQRLSQLLNC